MSYRKELAFGLDIGDRSLKLVQLRERKGGVEIVSFSVTELPPKLLDQGTILNEEGLALAIKEGLRKARLEASPVIAALPEARTFLKLLTLQKHGDTPLKELIAQEVGRHIPFSLEEIWWDFHIVTDRATDFSVLVGAAPKTLVAAYRGLLRRAGLTPLALDLEPLAAARALLGAPHHGQGVLLADIGATKSTLMTATPETILVTADGGASGDELTARIASALKVSIDAAEDLKKKHGLEPGAPPAYATMVQEYGTQLVELIKRMVHFSANAFPTLPPVSLILLTGGGALLKGLPQYLSQTLKITTQLGDSWLNVKSRLRSPLANEPAPHLSTACGLALSALTYAHR